MKKLRVGLIGSGFIGRAHAIALQDVGAVFPDVADAGLRDPRGPRPGAARRSRAAAMGFARATGDWRELVADPAVDVVDICSPNYLHREMALAAHRRRQARLVREAARARRRRGEAKSPTPRPAPASCT